MMYSSKWKKPIHIAIALTLWAVTPASALMTHTTDDQGRSVIKITCLKGDFGTLLSYTAGDGFFHNAGVADKHCGKGNWMRGPTEDLKKDMKSNFNQNAPGAVINKNAPGAVSKDLNVN